MIGLPCDVLEISYDGNQDEITILITHLVGAEFSIQKTEIEALTRKKVIIIKETLSKEDFASEIRHWQPTKYNRLVNLLFSRAELC